MFTGIIEEIGVVRKITTTRAGKKIAITAQKVLEEVEPGDSIAINGVCVTVVSCHPPTPRGVTGFFSAELLRRTWEVTTFPFLRCGDAVNCERALRAGERVGGHFVLGHVDGAGMITSRAKHGNDLVLEIGLPFELRKYCVAAGSLAVDGVSLTIASLLPNAVLVHLIPETRARTTLNTLKPGDRVNIETDVLGKHATSSSREIDRTLLRETGFM